MEQLQKQLKNDALLENIEVRLESAHYLRDERGIYQSGSEGYWSNLNKEENRLLIEKLSIMSPREAIQMTNPQYEQIIFSPKREAALELLQIQPGHICIDYGCMWGALSCGMAKRGGYVLSFDQTYASLVFLEYRRRHEQLNTIIPLQQDIRKVDLPGLADCSVVNGVLEWIPEMGEVELKKFHGKKIRRDVSSVSPYHLQYNFLQKVHGNLKSGGKLLLAIENRYDFTHFLGKKDPHADLWLTAVLPRSISNLVSKIVLDRPYVNYIYSFPALKNILQQVGFSKVELYMAFPGYHFPELVLPYEGGIQKFQPYGTSGYSWKRKVATIAERVLMKYFKAKFFAPSIVALATK